MKLVVLWVQCCSICPRTAHLCPVWWVSWAAARTVQKLQKHAGRSQGIGLKAAESHFRSRVTPRFNTPVSLYSWGRRVKKHIPQGGNEDQEEKRWPNPKVFPSGWLGQLRTHAYSRINASSQTGTPCAPFNLSSSLSHWQGWNWQD